MTQSEQRSSQARSAITCTTVRSSRGSYLKTLHDSSTNCLRSSMVVEVLDGGLSTTVQDCGRHGLYRLGVPPSGAMDDFSARVANLLVGNDERAAVLELTYLGPRLGFRDDAIVAVTGADMPTRVDGSPRPSWEAFEVKAGETLHFEYLRDGARSYVAVAGGFDVPEVLGSRST